jgi:hypothetical protein
MVPFRCIRSYVTLRLRHDCSPPCWHSVLSAHRHRSPSQPRKLPRRCRRKTGSIISPALSTCAHLRRRSPVTRRFRNASMTCTTGMNTAARGRRFSPVSKNSLTNSRRPSYFCLYRKHAGNHKRRAQLLEANKSEQHMKAVVCRRCASLKVSTGAHDLFAGGHSEDIFGVPG